MSNSQDSMKIPDVYLDAWREKESLLSSNNSIELTYNSRPLVADRIVTILGSIKEVPIFSGYLSIYPPFEITGVKILGPGTPGQAALILEFVSKKINAKVRMDMTANSSLFSKEELLRLKDCLNIIERSPRIATCSSTAIISEKNIP